MPRVLRTNARKATIAAAAAAIAVLVAPAIGQGKSEGSSLAWTHGGKKAISYYDFGTLASGPGTSTQFVFKNSGMSSSGKLAISLTGSTAFSITSDGCNGKNLRAYASCKVTVAYLPDGSGDGATLSATRSHKAPKSVSLFGGPGHVYWVVAGGDVNAVRPYGGPMNILTSGQAEPVSIAVDGTHVYWANAGVNGPVGYPGSNAGTGSVNEVPLGGGGVTALAAGLDYPCAVAVDGTNIYWIDCDSGTVNEAPLAGGAVTTLVTDPAGPSALAVDSTNVYWVDYGSGTVNEIPVGGGTVTTLASGQSNPSAIAIDGSDVYWTNFNEADTSGGSVNKVPLGGGSVTSLATGQSEPRSLAVDGTNVYWVNSYGGQVNKVPLAGGSVTTLASQQGSPESVTADGSYVYWVDGGLGTVNAVPIGGGSVTTLERGQAGALAVAVGP